MAQVHFLNFGFSSFCVSSQLPGIKKNREFVSKHKMGEIIHFEFHIIFKNLLLPSIKVSKHSNFIGTLNYKGRRPFMILKMGSAIILG